MNSDVIQTDAVIVGAGPVGLFQVFELGLLEIKAHIIDSLAYPGGQCIELYPDKPIYDIPAVPVCTGKELTDNLLKQIEPFGATFHLGQEVTQVEKQADGRFLVATSKGTRFLTKTVFIAGGVGSFQPRTLKVEGLDKFDGTQLHYRVRNPAQFAGKNLVIVGGGDSALDWALNFVQEGPNKAESVILIHRRDGFRAAPASVASRAPSTKDRAAMMATDHASRIVASTASGVVRFGSTSRIRIRDFGVAIASAASMYSWRTQSAVRLRVSLATRGMCVSATTRTISQGRGPSMDTNTTARTICGKARMTSISHISEPSTRRRL
jgi:thioredoxin reductase